MRLRLTPAFVLPLACALLILGAGCPQQPAGKTAGTGGGGEAAATAEQKPVAEQGGMGQQTWLMDYPDPDNILWVLLDSKNAGAPGNWSRYSNPEFDQLVESAQTMSDQAARQDAYERAEEIAYKDAPWLLLFNRKCQILKQPYVQGLNLTTLDRAPVIPGVDMEPVSFQGGGPADGVYRFPINTNIPTLDPAQVTDTVSSSVVNQIFDGLVKISPEGTLVENLAASYSVDPTGLTYTFQLRPGVKFHNGREMTSEDVVYSFTRILDPATGSPRQIFLDPLKGSAQFKAWQTVKRQANPLPDEDFAATVARARDAVAAMPVDTDDQKAQKESFENAFKALEGVTGPVDTVAGIVARGPHTVELTLEAPSGLFPWYLAQSTCVIVPREEVERYGQEWPNHPVGTGPFKVGPGTYNFAEGITLVRNDDYFKGPARLNGIRYIVEREEKKRIEGFKAGQYEHTDIPPEDFETVMADANLKGMLVERPTFDLYHIAFNCAKPPFKDNPQLRQALNYAVDKNYIAETVLKGTRVVAPSFMPVNFPNFTPRHQGYPYNAGEATRLLEEAGYPNGQGLPLLRLWCSNDPTHIQIMTAVQQDLKKVGVQVELKTLEWASFLETMDAGEY